MDHVSELARRMRIETRGRWSGESQEESKRNKEHKQSVINYEANTGSCLEKGWGDVSFAEWYPGEPVAQCGVA